MDSPGNPTRIGPYEVAKVIRRDGAGTVFKAMDPRDGRTVAIKVVTAGADNPDLLLLKFYREAKDTPKLKHENIATVYEIGYENGLPYMVGEYLKGESLEEIIAAKRPMPLAAKLKIIIEVCAGLSHAHTLDLIHRDINPLNIMVTEDGTPKIVDFGMARLRGSLADTGQSVANLNYISPEQASGDVDLDSRTDIYSTAVVLFQLLTGVLPFDGGTNAATLKKIAQDPPPPLGKYLNNCPPELEAITNKALAKKREDRQSTAEEFALDLVRVQQQSERQALEQGLQQAADLLARKDFARAREQVLEVLQTAPQNPEAGDLLRRIKTAQEQQERAEQISQLQAKAEEAFRKNEFAPALQFVEQALQLEPASAVVLRVREAILSTQEKMAKYREALERAESALQSGDLATSKQAIDRAIAFQPEDPQARKLAGQIRARIEQQMRELEVEQRRKKLALNIETVEKAMADARLLLLRGKLKEALQLLEGVKAQVAELPPKWGEEVDQLKKEARTMQAALPDRPVARIDQETLRPSPDRQSPPPDRIPRRMPTFDEEDARPLSLSGAEPRSTRDDLLSDDFSAEETRQRRVAPLRLDWRRPTLWLIVAAVILVLVLLFFVFRSQGENIPLRPSPTATTQLNERVGQSSPLADLVPYLEFNRETSADVS